MLWWTSATKSLHSVRVLVSLLDRGQVATRIDAIVVRCVRGGNCAAIFYLVDIRGQRERIRNEMAAALYVFDQRNYRRIWRFFRRDFSSDCRRNVSQTARVSSIWQRGGRKISAAKGREEIKRDCDIEKEPTEMFSRWLWSRVIARNAETRHFYLQEKEIVPTEVGSPSSEKQFVILSYWF